MIIALAWAFKDESHVQEMATWQKRLSKGEFLKLSKSGKERYIKLYPHSSHRFLMTGKEDPDNIEKKAPAPTGAKRFKDEDEIQKQRQRIAARKDISDFNKSNVAVINPSSLQALDSVKDEHLREASDNIQKNKKDIVAAVQQQQKKLPNMYGKGLGAVRDLVSGEQHPDDMSTTQKHAMHRVLGGVATMALLGAGVLAAGMAAAPLGVLLGATLFNVWAGSKHGKNLRDDIDELRAAREKKRRAERKANGADSQAFASSVFTPNESTEMSDADTIGLILDHVTDMLKYHSVKDFQEQRDEVFAGASASALKPEFAELRYLLSYAHCRDYTPQGDGVSFSCDGGYPTLEKLFKRMGYMVSATEDGDQVAYHFDNGKGRATLGKFDNNFYIRYDGDFDYRTVL
jgi:hypothetical protein